jgi:hypothetical protein
MEYTSLLVQTTIEYLITHQAFSLHTRGLPEALPLYQTLLMLVVEITGGKFDGADSLTRMDRLVGITSPEGLVKIFGED